MNNAGARKTTTSTLPLPICSTCVWPGKIFAAPFGLNEAGVVHSQSRSSQVHRVGTLVGRGGEQRIRCEFGLSAWHCFLRRVAHSPNRRALEPPPRSKSRYRPKTTKP